MVPNSAMGAHNDHAVKKSDPQQVKVEIVEKENKETGHQDQ
jgi:hypothetical protein